MVYVILLEWSKTIDASTVEVCGIRRGKLFHVVIVLGSSVVNMGGPFKSLVIVSPNNLTDFTFFQSFSMG